MCIKNNDLLKHYLAYHIHKSSLNLFQTPVYSKNIISILNSPDIYYYARNIGRDKTLLTYSTKYRFGHKLEMLQNQELHNQG